MSPLSQPNGRWLHRRGPAAKKHGRQRASSSSAHGDQSSQSQSVWSPKGVFILRTLRSVISVAVCMVAKGRLHLPHTEISTLKSSLWQSGRGGMSYSAAIAIERFENDETNATEHISTKYAESIYGIYNL